MSTLADSVTAHLQTVARERAATLSPEERREARREFCGRFDKLRSAIILPALSQAYDALRAQGHRANFFLDRSEAWRGLGALPAELELDRRVNSPAMANQPFECRMVWRVDDGDHLLVRAEFERMNTGQDYICCALEELSPEVVNECVLGFIELATKNQ